MYSPSNQCILAVLPSFFFLLFLSVEMNEGVITTGDSMARMGGRVASSWAGLGWGRVISMDPAERTRISK